MLVMIAENCKEFKELIFVVLFQFYIIK